MICYKPTLKNEVQYETGNNHFLKLAIFFGIFCLLFVLTCCLIGQERRQVESGLRFFKISCSVWLLYAAYSTFYRYLSGL
jgi:hypothetical protein